MANDINEEYKQIEITPSCGNVFEDMGLPDAKLLQSEFDSKFYKEKYCEAKNLLLDLIEDISNYPELEERLLDLRHKKFYAQHFQACKTVRSKVDAD